MNPDEFLRTLIGQWTGTCRTWFEPDKLADESEVQGEFKPILGGRFVRHTYEGQIQGQSRTGEETIVFNPARNQFQVSWIDDFHMNYGILWSDGVRTPNGFSVTGQYDVQPGAPHWNWKTVFELTDDDALTMTAFNISPEGQEAMATETKYKLRK
jgi:hypothetical protein